MTGGMEKCYQWNGTKKGTEKLPVDGKTGGKGFPGGRGGWNS